jgi:O-antigen/teichoic acid export membrane protein
MVLNIVTGILVARSLGPEGKGDIALFLVNLAILSQVYNFGIPEFSILSYGRKIYITEVIIWGGLVYSLLIFLIVSTVTVGVSVIFEYQLFKFAFLLIGGAFLETIATHFRHLLLGFKEIKKYNVNVLIQTLTYFGALIFLYLFNMFELKYILLSLIVSRFTSIMASVKVVSKYKLRRVIEQRAALWRYMKEINKNGYKFFFMGLGATLNQRMVYFFLNNSYSATQVGIYSVSETFPGLINVAASQISFVLFPYIANEKREGKRLTLIAMSLSLLIGFIALLFFWSFGMVIIDYVYGEAFAEAYFSMLVLIVALTVYSMNNSLTNYLITNGEVNTTTTGVVCSLLIVIVLLYCVIDNGFIFASLSILTVNMLMFSYYFTLFRKKSNLGIIDINELKWTLLRAFKKINNSRNE